MLIDYSCMKYKWKHTLAQGCTFGIHVTQKHMPAESQTHRYHDPLTYAKSLLGTDMVCRHMAV